MAGLFQLPPKARMTCGRCHQSAGDIPLCLGVDPRVAVEEFGRGLGWVRNWKRVNKLTPNPDKTGEFVVRRTTVCCVRWMYFDSGWGLLTYF